MQTGIVEGTALKHALLQKRFQLGIQLDRFVQRRVGTGGIGPHADQIAVPLVAGQQLFKLANPRVVGVCLLYTSPSPRDA